MMLQMNLWSGGQFEMGGAFRHKLNLKNNLEIFCNYVLIEFQR